MKKYLYLIFLIPFMYGQEYILEFNSNLAYTEISINGSTRNSTPYLHSVEKGIVKVDVFLSDTLFSSFDFKVEKDEKFKINKNKEAFLYLKEAKNYFEIFDDMEYFFAQKNGLSKDYFNHQKGDTKVYTLKKGDFITLSYPDHNNIDLDFKNLTPFRVINYYPIFKANPDGLTKNIDDMYNYRKSIYTYSMIGLGSVFVTSSILAISANSEANSSWKKYENEFDNKKLNKNYLSYSDAVSDFQIFSSLALSSAIGLLYIHYFSPYFDLESIQNMKYDLSLQETQVNFQLTYRF